MRLEKVFSPKSRNFVRFMCLRDVRGREERGFVGRN